VFQVVNDAKVRGEDNLEPLIALVRQLVDFTSWRFGRVESRSVISFSCDAAADRVVEIKQFLECYKRQQRRLDPRAIAIVHDSAYPHAVTLTMTMPDGTNGMLVLLRDESLGTFSENEQRLLALAKVLGEECLASTLVAEEARDATTDIMQRSKPLLFILNRSYEIVMGHRNEKTDDPDLAALSAEFTTRLPPVLEEAVRGLTTDWAKDPAISVNAFTMPLPFLSLRVHAMNSASDAYLAVTIERMRRRNILLRAAKRFLITPREREVASFLLDGMRIDEIGERLCISTSTVNDHVKKLLERTGSSNRSQMLARILGWQSSKSAPVDAD
jgi:DNA-binding CsgD family transcriptional regulator